MRLPAVILALGLSFAALAEDPPPPAVPASASADSATAPAARERATMDRLELETTAITGNRELPKVLYIVPWKKPSPADLSSRPLESVLDEALAPVDRDVFRRQVRYDGQVQTRAAAPAAAGAATPVVERK